MTNSTLKHSGYKIGQTIKSFDFEPMESRPDRFVQGEIIDIPQNRGYDCYEVKADKISSKHYTVGESVFVPMEVMFLEYDNRIQEVK